MDNRGKERKYFSTAAPRQSAMSGAVVYSLNLLIVSFLLERCPLEFWRSCSPNIYKAVDLAEKGWIIMDAIMPCP